MVKVLNVAFVLNCARFQFLRFLSAPRWLVRRLWRGQIQNLNSKFNEFMNQRQSGLVSTFKTASSVTNSPSFFFFSKSASSRLGVTSSRSQRRKFLFSIHHHHHPSLHLFSASQTRTKKRKIRLRPKLPPDFSVTKRATATDSKDDHHLVCSHSRSSRDTRKKDPP
jgi:hypothetical protein